MLSSDFHGKENYGTTGAEHLNQTFLAIFPGNQKSKGLANHRSLIFRQKRTESSALLQSFHYFTMKILKLNSSSHKS